MKKSDIKKLVKESIRELKEQAYGSATLTTQGAPRTRAVAPADKDPYTGRVEYPYTVGAKTKRGMMEKEDLKEFTAMGQEGIYPRKEEPGDMFQQKEVEELLPNGMASRDDREFQARLKQHADWTEESGYNNTFVHIQYHDSFDREHSYRIHQSQNYNGNYDDFRNPKFTVLTITKKKEGKEEELGRYIVDTDAYLKDFAKLRNDGVLGKQVSEGEGGTGIDEDSIRINMEQAPPGGEEEEGKEELKSKEEPPKHSLEKIGKCKAGCIDLEIENLEIKVENLETKLSDISKKRGDAKPSEIEGLEKQKTEFLAQIIATEEQIESKKEEQTKLLNPEEQKESINKKNMKNNVKQLWSDYANSRIGSNLKENQKSERKLARRKILQEGVMNTFFEYFSQGNTNEEIVQLYAGKGVQVPEQFVKSARSQFENQTKLNAEMEMSELNFKNEASQIINNPATMEMDGSTTEDDKQLAAGLFKEQDEIPVKPEKEHKDVDMLLKRISTINIPGEFESVFKKLMTHSTEISGLSTSKVIGMLKQAIKEI